MSALLTDLFLASSTPAGSASGLSEQPLLWAIPLLPLLGFVLNGLFGKKLSPVASGGLATASIAAAFVCSLIVFFGSFGGENAAAGYSHSIEWMTLNFGDKSFHLQWGLRVDQLAAVLMLIITGVGSLIHLYSIGYMSHDKAYWRYFAYLNLFCFAMLCLALGDNMVLLFLGWEGVGLCSYLLIGFWYEDMEKAKAGKKAFIANRVGDLGFLIGMFLIAWHFGTLEFAGINAQMAAMDDIDRAANSGLFNWACFFLFVGATGKSAQIPLYVWLPDAMAGPTPVSALIHAATMVTAGVYMCARMNMVMDATTWVLPMIALVGGLTALFAATIGLVQRDIKKVLAYSTVSQLGFMFMAVGAGAYAVAVFHLMTHAFFKAQLFLGSGSVIHAMDHAVNPHHGHDDHGDDHDDDHGHDKHAHKHEWVDPQDMANMGGLKAKMPITCWTMVMGGLALAGFPLITAGFYSKDEILLNVGAAATNFNWLADYSLIYTIVFWLGTAAAAFTAFYTARLLGLTFFGKYRGPEGSFEKIHESPITMTLPLMILGVLSVVGGFINMPHLFGHYQFLGDFLGSVNIFGDHADHANTAATFHHHSGLMTKDGWAAMSGSEMMGLVKSGVIAVLFFGIGLMFFSKAGSWQKEQALASGAAKPIHKLLFHKYWVDEIYEFVFIKPIRVASLAIWLVVDLIFIDLLMVNGAAFGTGGISHMLRRLQTGIVSHYLYVFAVGVAVILLAYFL